MSQNILHLDISVFACVFSSEFVSLYYIFAFVFDLVCNGVQLNASKFLQLGVIVQ